MQELAMNIIYVFIIFSAVLLGLIIGFWILVGGTLLLLFILSAILEFLFGWLMPHKHIIRDYTDKEIKEMNEYLERMRK